MNTETKPDPRLLAPHSLDIANAILRHHISIDDRRFLMNLTKQIENTSTITTGQLKTIEKLSDKYLGY